MVPIFFRIPRNSKKKSKRTNKSPVLCFKSELEFRRIVKVFLLCFRNSRSQRVQRSERLFWQVLKYGTVDQAVWNLPNLIIFLWELLPVLPVTVCHSRRGFWRRTENECESSAWIFSEYYSLSCYLSISSLEKVSFQKASLFWCLY